MSIKETAEAMWRNSHMAARGVTFENEDRTYFIRLATEEAGKDQRIMTEYTTRNLTVDESAALVRKLHIALGKPAHIDAALRVIAELGFGIFAATPVNDTEDPNIMSNPHHERLEHLRRQIRAQRISYGEIAELQSLAPHIDPDDVELLQWGWRRRTPRGIMTAYDVHEVDTPAGTYTVELHADQDSENPLTSWDQEGLAFYIVGNRDSVLLDTLNDADKAGDALRTWINAEHDVEDIERRFAKWKAITGNPWVLVTGDDFDSQQSWGWMVLVDTSLTYVASDGKSYPALPDPKTVTIATMADYRTWAAGEVCGYIVKAPNGDDVESVWSFYSDDDAIEQATSAAEGDAIDRVNQAGLVGAGIVGLI